MWTSLSYSKNSVSHYKHKITKLNIYFLYSHKPLLSVSSYHQSMYITTRLWMPVNAKAGYCFIHILSVVRSVIRNIEWIPFFLQITSSKRKLKWRLTYTDKMAYEILRSIMKELEVLDVEHLKYILRDNFTGKSCRILYSLEIWCKGISW